MKPSVGTRADSTQSAPQEPICRVLLEPAPLLSEPCTPVRSMSSLVNVGWMHFRSGKYRNDTVPWTLTDVSLKLQADSTLGIVGELADPQDPYPASLVTAARTVSLA